MLVTVGILYGVVSEEATTPFSFQSFSFSRFKLSGDYKTRLAAPLKATRQVPCSIRSLIKRKAASDPGRQLGFGSKAGSNKFSPLQKQKRLALKWRCALAAFPHRFSRRRACALLRPPESARRYNPVVPGTGWFLHLTAGSKARPPAHSGAGSLISGTIALNREREADTTGPGFSAIPPGPPLEGMYLSLK
jgi:hypothetical protein